MNKEFRLPDVGEGLTEADIVAWHVKPGDTVRINQVIVDIETAKAVVELPSPYAGTVSALLVEVGQTVDVGTPIIAVDVPSADGAEPEPVKPAQQPGGQADAASQEPGPPETGSQDTDAKEAKDAPQENVRQPVLVGYGVKPGSTRRRARKQPPTRPGSYPATPSAPPSAPPPGRRAGPGVPGRDQAAARHSGAPRESFGSGRAFCGRTPEGKQSSGQAAGAAARQGSRRRPGRTGGQRAGGLGHPGRCRARGQCQPQPFGS